MLVLMSADALRRDLEERISRVVMTKQLWTSMSKYSSACIETAIWMLGKEKISLENYINSVLLDIWQCALAKEKLEKLEDLEKAHYAVLSAINIMALAEEEYRGAEFEKNPSTPVPSSDKVNKNPTEDDGKASPKRYLDLGCL
jgi:hypothetical protein